MTCKKELFFLNGVFPLGVFSNYSLNMHNFRVNGNAPAEPLDKGGEDKGTATGAIISRPHNSSVKVVYSEEEK